VVVKTEASKHTTHVIIGGESLFYDAKAPYEISGMSVKGALEYDKAHGMSAREYKLRHGLRLGAALMNESMRKARIASGLALAERLGPEGVRARSERALVARAASGSPLMGFHKSAEHQNSKRICDAQVVARLREIGARLGQTPTLAELRDVGLDPMTLRRHFGSLAAALRMAGLQPRGTRWTDDALLAFISNFISVHKRDPRQSDCLRGLIPNDCSYRKRFGSLAAAVALARRGEHSGVSLPAPTRVMPTSASTRVRRSNRFRGTDVGKSAIGGMA